MNNKNNLILLVIVTIVVSCFSFIPVAAADSTDPGDTGSSAITTQNEVNSADSVQTGPVSLPVLFIGKRNQKVNDVTLSEGSAGAIESEKIWLDSTDILNITKQSSDETAYIKLTSPSGVTFSSVPTVSVSSGNLRVYSDQVSLLDEDHTLAIPIRSQSTVASVITISNIMLDLDRTVKDGPVELIIGGNALNQTLDINGDNGLFPASPQLSVTVGICKGESTETLRSTASFVVGAGYYTLNGIQTPLDVAPYIKDGHVFVPLRNLVSSLGIGSQDVLWNSADQTVTIMKKPGTIQYTIGSNRMLINGISVDIGAGPEIADNRVMIPLSSITHITDSIVTWDEVKQTANLVFVNPV